MSMNMNKKHAEQDGFTLIELLMVVLLLSIIVGAVFSQIERAQVPYKVEDQKVDLTQQEREFIDQFTRDLHQAGYPSIAVFGAQYNINSSHIAAGVWLPFPRQIYVWKAMWMEPASKTVEYSYFDGTGWPGLAQSVSLPAAQCSAKSGRHSAFRAGGRHSIHASAKCCSTGYAAHFFRL